MEAFDDPSEERDTWHCDRCLGGTAVSYCHQCQNKYCEACEKRHGGLTHFSAHKCAAVTDVTFCAVHVRCACELFCETCARLICAQCLIMEHCDHTVTSVDEAVAATRGRLDDLADGTIEKSARYAEHAKTVRKAVKISDAFHATFRDKVEQVNEAMCALSKQLGELYKGVSDRVFSTRGKLREGLTAPIVSAEDAATCRTLRDKLDRNTLARAHAFMSACKTVEPPEVLRGCLAKPLPELDKLVLEMRAVTDCLRNEKTMARVARTCRFTDGINGEGDACPASEDALAEIKTIVLDSSCLSQADSTASPLPLSQLVTPKRPASGSSTFFAEFGAGPPEGKRPRISSPPGGATATQTAGGEPKVNGVVEVNSPQAAGGDTNSASGSNGVSSSVDFTGDRHEAPRVNTERPGSPPPPGGSTADESSATTSPGESSPSTTFTPETKDEKGKRGTTKGVKVCKDVKDVKGVKGGERPTSPVPGTPRTPRASPSPSTTRASPSPSTTSTPPKLGFAAVRRGEVTLEAGQFIHAMCVDQKNRRLAVRLMPCYEKTPIRVYGYEGRLVVSLGSKIRQLRKGYEGRCGLCADHQRGMYVCPVAYGHHGRQVALAKVSAARESLLKLGGGVTAVADVQHHQDRDAYLLALPPPQPAVLFVNADTGEITQEVTLRGVGRALSDPLAVGMGRWGGTYVLASMTSPEGGNAGRCALELLDVTGKRRWEHRFSLSRAALLRSLAVGPTGAVLVADPATHKVSAHWDAGGGVRQETLLSIAPPEQELGLTEAMFVTWGLSPHAEGAHDVTGLDLAVGCNQKDKAYIYVYRTETK